LVLTGAILKQKGNETLVGSKFTEQKTTLPKLTRAYICRSMEDQHH
jgi:hypothetical protein